MKASQNSKVEREQSPSEAPLLLGNHRAVRSYGPTWLRSNRPAIETAIPAEERESRFAYQIREVEGAFQDDSREIFACVKCGYEWTQADINSSFHPVRVRQFHQEAFRLERHENHDEYLCPRCAAKRETDEILSKPIKVSKEAEDRVAHRAMIQARIAAMKLK